jgi:Tfp pilus assembly protein PilE
MKFSLKKQQGLTFISLFFILAAIGIVVLLTLKIAPIYMNHSKVLNALAALENTTDVERMSKREIASSLEKRFGMNYVEYVDDENIKITRHGNYVKVEIEYERVEKIVGNLSVLVEFYDYFEKGRDE